MSHSTPDNDVLRDELKNDMQTVAREFRPIKVGDPTRFGGLTIFPLFRNGSMPDQPGDMLLEEAVVRCLARVSATHDAPSVWFASEPVVKRCATS